jgi:CHAD domain-containing protein
MAKTGGKWIEGVEPDAPAAKAARKTLRRRLRSVWSLLRETRESDADAAESVHQLRVATRRGMAALQGYAELLPRRKADWMQKQLTRLRRRAGEARDYDVLRQRLAERSDADRLRPLIERIDDLRREAKKPIRRAYRKLRKRDFSHRTKRLIAKIHAPPSCREATFLAWARLGLSRSVEAFFIAAGGDLNDLAAMHQFRIEGKLLRYALEYFAAAFGPEVRVQLYPEIERVQELLGLVNDHASAIAYFEQWRAEWDDAELSPLLDALIAGEKEGLHEARQEFFRWWTPQRTSELKQRFAEVLQPAGHEEVA